jgi:predicted PhzF superfamily epimerase YddE/YHI9
MKFKVTNVFSINNQGGNPCAIIDKANNFSTEEMQIKASYLKFGACK